MTFFRLVEFSPITIHFLINYFRGGTGVCTTNYEDAIIYALLDGRKPGIMEFWRAACDYKPMHRDTFRKHLEPFLKYRYVMMEEKNRKIEYFLNSERIKFFEHWKSGPDFDEMIEKLTESFENPISSHKISKEQLTAADNFIQEISKRQMGVSHITNSEIFDDLVKKLAKNEFEKYSKIIELVLAIIKKNSPDALLRYQILFFKKMMKEDQSTQKSWEKFQRIFMNYSN